MAQYGLIEAGGTKFLLGIADQSGAISARQRIATTSPADTLRCAIEWFRTQCLAPAAIGIASFGPLDLDRASPHWGQIGCTPKPGWTGTDLAGPVGSAFSCPVGLETDVNGAALAEARWGAGAGEASLLYLTIGTGIGGGFVTRGHLLHGQSHPEMGHIRVPRHPEDRAFSGVCRIHGDCLEGVASGPSVTARWGASLSDLPADHPGHAMIAWYLGQAVCTFQAIMQPARIVLGGGVSAAPGLLDRVRMEAAKAGAGYFAGDPATVVVPPGLGSDSGLLGALATALATSSLAIR